MLLSAKRALYPAAFSCRIRKKWTNLSDMTPAERASSIFHRSVACSGRAEPSAIIGDSQLKKRKDKNDADTSGVTGAASSDRGGGGGPCLGFMNGSECRLRCQQRILVISERSRKTSYSPSRHSILSSADILNQLLARLLLDDDFDFSSDTVILNVKDSFFIES